jgi:general secretion pathway protein N
MMRFVLPLGRWLFLLVVFLLAAAINVPMRVALDQLGFDERGFGAREVSGSIWSAQLTEARLRGLALGDVEAGLSLLPLLVGEARVALVAPGWRGTLLQSADAAGIAGLSGRLGPESLPATLPVGSVEFEAVDARFAGGVCTEATGTLRLEAKPTIPAMATLGQLSGPLRCDGDALLAAMVSGSGRERVDLRLFGDGRYRLTLVVRADDEATTAALTSAGFVATTDGLTMSSEGSF